MVSHAVAVATSPVVAPAHPPTPTLPPLNTIIKLSPSAGFPPKKALHKLFDLGHELMEDGDEDVAAVYVRALEAALRGHTLRNHRMERKISAARKANAKLRAIKVDKRIQAEAASAAAQQA